MIPTQRKFLVIPLTAALVAAFLASIVLAQSEPPDRVRVLRSSNLRAGPGTTFAIVGGAAPGTEFDVIGCNEPCDWYELETGQWIAAFLAEAIATPIPTPTNGVAAAIQPTTVTLTVVGWNVESSSSDPEIVAERIAAFEGVDLWGLSEVQNDTVAAIFERMVSRSGRSDRLVNLYNADRFEVIGRDELEYIKIGGTMRADFGSSPR